MTIGSAVPPSALRARIDGTVVRLPGTGEGVARLVPVSIVTLDMRAPLAAPRPSSQTALVKVIGRDENNAAKKCFVYETIGTLKLAPS